MRPNSHTVWVLYCLNVNKLLINFCQSVGVLIFFKMADCWPTEFFKMADLFITEDLYRPGTLDEEENRSEENDS